MKCKECNSDLEKATAPKSLYSISIPFTSLTIELWSWGNEEYYCLACTNEKEQRPLDEAYITGEQAGYDRRIQD